MKSRCITVSICLATFLLWPPSPGTAQDPDAPDKAPMTTSPDVPELPGGLMVVAESDVQILVEGIETDLRRAQEENAAGRSAPAAKNLMKAAAAVRLEMSRSPKSDRASLMAASDSIVAVATVLRNNRSTSRQKIERVAGLAHSAVAEHQLQLAERAWEAHDNASTGEELQSSLEHFAAAADWLKGGIASPDAAKYHAWVQLAGELRQGEGGWSADQVRSALAEYRTELGRVTL